MLEHCALREGTPHPVHSCHDGPRCVGCLKENPQQSSYVTPALALSPTALAPTTHARHAMYAISRRGVHRTRAGGTASISSMSVPQICLFPKDSSTRTEIDLPSKHASLGHSCPKCLNKLKNADDRSLGRCSTQSVLMFSPLPYM